MFYIHLQTVGVIRLSCNEVYVMLGLWDSGKVFTIPSCLRQHDQVENRPFVQIHGVSATIQKTLATYSTYSCLEKSTNLNATSRNMCKKIIYMCYFIYKHSTTHIHIQTNIGAHTQMHTQPHTHACAHTRMHTLSHTHSHACTDTHARAHAHTLTHTRTHAQTRTRARTHTHPHTHYIYQ